MPYEQGPLLLQDAANVGIETSDYNFTGYTDDQLIDVDPILASWDSFFDDATLLLDEPEDPYPDVDLSAASDVLNAYTDPVSLFGMDDILTAMSVAAVSLSGAIGSAPAEAWQDPTVPFVAPAPAQVISVPFIPFSALDVKVAGATGTAPPILQPPVPVIPATVSLTNLTDYGSGNFTVGDQGQISVTGSAGATIYVRAALNGQDLGTSYVGSVGDDGTFTLPFTEGADAVGTWEQIWSVGGRNVVTFDFVVFDAD